MKLKTNSGVNMSCSWMASQDWRLAWLSGQHEAVAAISFGWQRKRREEKRQENKAWQSVNWIGRKLRSVRWNPQVSSRFSYFPLPAFLFLILKLSFSIQLHFCFPNFGESHLVSSCCLASSQLVRCFLDTLDQKIDDTRRTSREARPRSGIRNNQSMVAPVLGKRYVVVCRVSIVSNSGGVSCMEQIAVSSQTPGSKQRLLFKLIEFSSCSFRCWWNYLIAWTVKVFCGSN